MHPRSVFFAAVFAVVSLVGAPAIAPAAPSGLAWDSVTKFVMGSSDVGSLREPGNFDADYATAAAVQPAQTSGGGGFLNKIKQISAFGKNFSQMMKNGFADKHYIAGSKERVDQVAYQKATITDCGARTITTLDLAKKTYRVESMDHPSTGSSSSGGESSGSTGKDDGSKVAIDIKNTALGPKLVAGQSTNGFTSDTTFTETTKTGETHSTTANVVGYYSNYPHQTVHCGSYRSSAMPSVGGTGEGMTMMSGFTRMLDLMSSAGIPNDRLSIKQSGPNLPLDRLAMYDAASFKGDSSHSMSIVTERGNVRSIDANDPAFGIPAGFTKED